MAQPEHGRVANQVEALAEPPLLEGAQASLQTGPVQVAAFYGFTAMAALPELQVELRALAEAGWVRGTILLAEEGVNGTISGPEPGVQAVLARLRQLPGLSGLEAKFSEAPDQAVTQPRRLARGDAPRKAREGVLGHEVLERDEQIGHA